MNAAGYHRTAFTRLPQDGLGLPHDHRARAAEDLLVRTADPRRAANSHTASRGNQLREAATAVIADMRHIRNGTGPYFTLRSYGREQPQRPQGASLLNHRQIP